MNTRGLWVIVLLSTAAVLTCVSPANAAPARVYLSVRGSDSNNCSVTAPCRLLPTALKTVAAGGEIWLLDPGDFNKATVAIDKSVSILGVPAQAAGIVAVNGAAVVAQTANTEVSLRNVVIHGDVPGNTNAGVFVNSTTTLRLEQSLLTNLGKGVDVMGPARAYITGTTVRQVTSTAIHVHDGATAYIARVTIDGAGDAGIVSTGGRSNTTTIVTASDSSVSNAAGNAFDVYADDAFLTARLHVFRCTAVGNRGAGFHANGPPTTQVSLTVGASMAANNAMGFQQLNNALFRSLGNNQVYDNTTDVSGTITSESGR